MSQQSHEAVCVRTNAATRTHEASAYSRHASTCLGDTRSSGLHQQSDAPLLPPYGEALPDLGRSNLLLLPAALTVHHPFALPRIPLLQTRRCSSECDLRASTALSSCARSIVEGSMKHVTLPLLCAAGSECDGMDGASGRLGSECGGSDIEKRGCLEELPKLYHAGISVITGWNVMKCHSRPVCDTWRDKDGSHVQRGAVGNELVDIQAKRMLLNAGRQIFGLPRAQAILWHACICTFKGDRTGQTQ